MWEKQGEITILPGDYVDFSYVYDWYKDMSEKSAFFNAKLDSDTGAYDRTYLA